MKGKSINFSNSDSKMNIIFVLIAFVIIAIVVFICLNLNKKSYKKESFEQFSNIEYLENKDDPKGDSYEYATARAGHGIAYGTLVKSKIGKGIAEKDTISKKECPLKNNKKGNWSCGELTYPDGRQRITCGCMYDTEENDKLNLFTKNNFDLKQEEME